jgi:hypothetical protein
MTKKELSSPKKPLAIGKPPKPRRITSKTNAIWVKN